MTRDDLAVLSPTERAELAQWLAELGDRSAERSPLWRRAQRRRRLIIAVTVAAAVALVPWTIWLSVSLPVVHRAGEWRAAWVGFDCVLIVAIATTAWMAWRRRRAVLLWLVASGTLLACDAWFDVLLSSGGRERAASDLTAVLIEIPLAVLFLWSAVRALRVLARQPAAGS